MFDVDRVFAHDRMKKPKNNNKIKNDYRVYWSPGLKWLLPTCVMSLMSDKGEWNNSSLQSWLELIRGEISKFCLS